MRICVLADDQLKSEFLQKGVNQQIEIIWADSLKVFYSVSDVDVYFDLLFSADKERISNLSRVNGKPLFINSVNHTLEYSDLSYIRINAWPTMLNRKTTELAVRDGSRQETVVDICNKLGWSCQFVPDIVGMVTPRVISMIINEAFYTLEQEVSSRDEIDIAMKLGTNYPMGPFEWCEKIGIRNVHSLLEKLSAREERYQPSKLLSKEAEESL